MRILRPARNISLTRSPRADDREGRGPPIRMLDGTSVPRLPGIHRWMWDGELVGRIDAGLPFVELTTNADNLVSQRVIAANGGVLHERFAKPASFGGAPGLRYGITL